MIESSTKPPSFIHTTETFQCSGCQCTSIKFEVLSRTLTEDIRVGQPKMPLLQRITEPMPQQQASLCNRLHWKNCLGVFRGDGEEFQNMCKKKFQFVERE